MFDKTIEDLVTEHLSFNSTSPQWNKIYCEVCGDGSRTQGPRGGWLFQDEMAFYHCFNCGIDGNFDPDREFPFSKDMRIILDAFSIPKEEYNAIAYSKRVFDNKTKKVVQATLNYPVMEIPDYFCKLDTCDKENVYYQQALNELNYRNIHPSDYPFYLSTGISKGSPRDKAIAKSLIGRLIIPYFDTKGRMIYYQGRSLDKESKKRYINADVQRSAVIYGMEQLNKNMNYPLYVTEGFFDAYHLKGVALLENNITHTQLEYLKKSKRKKIFVPDKHADSSKIIDAFVKEGWHVSIPEFGHGVKDVDDAIRKYGKLYTFYTISNNVKDAEVGKILLGLDGFLYK